MIVYRVEAECTDCGTVIVLGDPSEAEKWGEQHECP